MRAHWLVGVVTVVGVLAGQEFERLTPDLAGQAVGQVATVCGLVVGVDCDSGLASGIVLRTSSGLPRFGVSFAPLAVFDTGLARGYFGRQVCATGTVLSGATGLSIRASSADQLTVEPTPGVETARMADDVQWCVEVPPSVIHETKPQYPPQVMRAGVEGTVLVLAIVDTDGSVRYAGVISSLDPDLDEEAVKAVEQWIFKPGMSHGVVVPTAVTIEMAFRLKKK